MVRLCLVLWLCLEVRDEQGHAYKLMGRVPNPRLRWRQVAPRLSTQYVPGTSRIMWDHLGAFWKCSASGPTQRWHFGVCI